MERNSIEIRVWMRRKGIRLVNIQRELEFRTHKTVRATIEGAENNRRVLAWLRDAGCPKKHLALPADMRKVA
ncbi:MAG: hypothetical protein LBD10_14555 [Desulfobulbus sp.]|jgi:hypothetical protein|uniref:hypothetical protein n=1 Tax=Desulfobulbus sp. TaxID=895 RepID=UPI00284DB6E4|nr:hypothetical protein [Desulfobulbus sp.]MDR2551410.1 hypothetical protein [Desulfobulbus sp.]